jgi:hypothetical protein
MVLGAASSAWASEDCFDIRLTRAESGLAASAAQKTVRFPIDAKSLSACRIGKHRFANFDTIRQAQPDGAVIWEGVGCQKEADKSWNCFPYLQRAVQFEPGPGATRIWVNIPPDMDAASAARIVSEAYSRAAEIEANKVCSQPSSPASFANYRRVFRDEAAGELRLMPEKSLRPEGKGLVLNRGDFYVSLEQASETDPTWRVVCWDELEYL